MAGLSPSIFKARSAACLGEMDNFAGHEIAIKSTHHRQTTMGGLKKKFFLPISQVAHVIVVPDAF
jgi:hypothetical protein